MSNGVDLVYEVEKPNIQIPAPISPTRQFNEVAVRLPYRGNIICPYQYSVLWFTFSLLSSNHTILQYDSNDNYILHIGIRRVSQKFQYQYKYFILKNYTYVAHFLDILNTSWNTFHIGTCSSPHNIYDSTNVHKVPLQILITKIVREVRKCRTLYKKQQTFLSTFFALMPVSLS